MHLSHFASAQNVAHGRPTPTTPKTSCGGSLSTPQASVDGCRALTSFVAPGVPPWKEFLPANLSRPPLQGRVSTTPLTPSAAIASNKVRRSGVPAGRAVNWARGPPTSSSLCTIRRRKERRGSTRRCCCLPPQVTWTPASST